MAHASHGRASSCSPPQRLRITSQHYLHTSALKNRSFCCPSAEAHHRNWTKKDRSLYFGDRIFAPCQQNLIPGRTLDARSVLGNTAWCKPSTTMWWWSCFAGFVHQDNHRGFAFSRWVSFLSFLALAMSLPFLAVHMMGIYFCSSLFQIEGLNLGSVLSSAFGNPRASTSAPPSEWPIRTTGSWEGKQGYRRPEAPAPEQFSPRDRLESSPPGQHSCPRICSATSPRQQWNQDDLTCYFGS